MDLMIEAKNKEQAVFELVRTFKLPGFERFNDIIPTFETMITSLSKQRQRKRPRRRARKRRQRMS
jgi:UV DNA damage endonuclease